jgi:hypothetical protein
MHALRWQRALTRHGGVRATSYLANAKVDACGNPTLATRA